VGWWLIIALSVVVFIPSASQLYLDVRTVCVSAQPCALDQLSPDAFQGLQGIGWSPSMYATFSLSLAIISMLAWLGVGLFIAWRKWNDQIALLVSMQAVTQSVNQVTAVETFHTSAWLVPAIAISFLSGWLLFLVFALFPNGRFTPRWMRWVAFAYFPYNIVNSIPGTLLPDDINAWLSPASFVIWFTFMGLLIIGQIYRYRYVSGPVEQQQTKWIVFAFIVIITSEFALAIPAFIDPALGQPSSLYGLTINSINTLILLIGPVCIMVAILRYRLYDIDILIKRTLVYGSLTAILAALYFGLVIGAQTLTHHLTGQQVAQQPVVIVLSTLLIAALAQPLRRRLQRTIDRRFDRSRYDAAKTIAAFSASLRSEVNLAQLNEHLLGVVEVTMRPTHASLWLRPTAHKANRGE
jgi:hypothetical protein